MIDTVRLTYCEVTVNGPNRKDGERENIRRKVRRNKRRTRRNEEKKRSKKRGEAEVRENSRQHSLGLSIQRDAAVERVGGIGDHKGHRTGRAPRFIRSARSMFIISPSSKVDQPSAFFVPPTFCESFVLSIPSSLRTLSANFVAFVPEAVSFSFRPSFF